jgi:hypothetical protein
MKPMQFRNRKQPPSQQRLAGSRLLVISCGLPVFVLKTCCRTLLSLLRAE